MLLLPALLCLAPLAVGGSQPARPNFLFVLTDDQDTLLGGGLPVMPALVSLAARGKRFDRAFTSSPICCPSRTSLFSGRYAHN